MVSSGALPEAQSSPDAFGKPAVGGPEGIVAWRPFGPTSPEAFPTPSPGGKHSVRLQAASAPEAESAVGPWGCGGSRGAGFDE